MGKRKFEVVLGPEKGAVVKAVECEGWELSPAGLVFFNWLTVGKALNIVGEPPAIVGEKFVVTAYAPGTWLGFYELEVSKE